MGKAVWMSILQRVEKHQVFENMRSDSYSGRRKCRLWEDICGRENNDPAYWRWDSDSSGKARDDL